jgi:hypothetical protein
MARLIINQLKWLDRIVDGKVGGGFIHLQSVLHLGRVVHAKKCLHEMQL